MYPHNSQEMQAALNAAFGIRPADMIEGELRAKVCALWGQARSYIESPAPPKDARRCAEHLELQHQIARLAGRVGLNSAQSAASLLYDQIQKRGDERELLPLYFLVLMAVVMCHRATNNRQPC